MSSRRKTLQKVLSGTSDANVSFREIRSLVVAMGFDERVRGDHFIFTREGIAEIINLQPKGRNAKPYQVRQVRDLILKYRLGEEL